MKTDSKTINYLKDFKELEVFTPEMTIEFVLGKEKTRVKTTYKVRNSKNKKEIFFNGEELKLISVTINEKETKEFDISDEGILVKNIPHGEFKLTFVNEIEPNKNTDLEGLYQSGDMLCTQNEPMGFRRITYALDRPDNMVKCKVKILGDKKEFPFMLSNGNLIEKGKEKNLHFCEWEDPFPKPLYLFALVAGDLAEVTDSYTTKKGKKVDIKFYCDHGAEEKCAFAIESLKKSMKWDEERFRLEYDLDLYMVVAVDSFNMGAMENKGLNIFNSALVLASPKSATDLNYHRIESVIGHEYFHNWTGNRVTLKNWFQLTLKEGLTVFRDQEFSSDLNDAAVERIDMVKSLKERQFQEDASPLAHPIRPDKYKEMNNFYTATVYEKGAEIIRMVHILLGEEKFQRGMDEYFKKYDGMAITTEDFLNTMADQEPELDREHFSRWYKTPGTPHVEIVEKYDKITKGLLVTFKQSNKMAQEKKQGYAETYIPLLMSLYDSKGKKYELKAEAKNQPFLTRGMIVLKEKETEVTFKNIPEDYVGSYFEKFSAPVTYEVKGQKNLEALIKYDQDNFNRYFATNESAVSFAKQKNKFHIPSLQYVFKEGSITNLMKANLLGAPTFSDFVEGKDKYDPVKVCELIEGYMNQVGTELGEVFYNYLQENPLKPYTYSLEEKGQRALYFTLLEYLFASDSYKKSAVGIAKKLYKESDNMSTSSTIVLLSNVYQASNSKEMNLSFYEYCKDDTLMLQKWISSFVSGPDFKSVKAHISSVENMESYDIKVPNFIRALWGSFYKNHRVFHHKSGGGYQLLMDALFKIDKINPQMSSALMKAFGFAPKLEGENFEKIKKIFAAKKGAKMSTHLGETYDSIYQSLN